MSLRKLMLSIGAGVVIGGSALAAPKATAPQKVEVINTVQTSEVAKPDKPDPKDAPCDPPKDVRTSDLCAQWKAADAADRAALWTIVAFVVGTGVNVATLIVVGLTFRETAKQTRVAIDTLNAGAPYVAVSKATAYIVIGAEELRAGEGLQLEAVELHFECEWKNFGDRPALGAGFASGVNFYTSETGEPDYFGDDMIFERTTLQKDETYHRTYGVVGPELIAKHFGDRALVRLSARGTYSDRLRANEILSSEQLLDVHFPPRFAWRPDEEGKVYGHVEEPILPGVPSSIVLSTAAKHHSFWHWFRSRDK
ncbi:hypothetical protein [Asticcacaulis sp.]|uniref:hypothetical protein n=1 Tax=Asticcacaulis sp. TaxID=1872648 RepID=UPI00391BF134